MIDELKFQLQKTFGRKIEDRGDCESLVQDIYEKTGAVLSYNTLRRMFGLAEYRKPRESTLDQLAVYCGFRSFLDFCQRFTDVDTWPSWESLYVLLSKNNCEELIEMLRFRKFRNDQFTISFTIVVRELLYRKDLESLIVLFREPTFQFANLPYDEVAQIGVLVGLHFRNFNDWEFEKCLLQEPNFRDLVFKIFVDYGRLNSKYGLWVQYLNSVNNLDTETQTFINCIEIWRQILTNYKVQQSLLAKLPQLSNEQHPILFGRIFGVKFLNAKSKGKRVGLLEQMQQRISEQPHLVTELLYEPAVQSLVTNHPELQSFVYKHTHLVLDIKFWYHFSQVSIHRVFQVCILLKEKQYLKAGQILDNIPYGHIRHGYREFIEMYVSFFRWKIALENGALNEKELYENFMKQRQNLNYPLFTDSYFANYFNS